MGMLPNQNLKTDFSNLVNSKTEDERAQKLADICNRNGITKSQLEEAQSIVKCMKPIGEKYTYDFVDSALSDRDLEEADIIDYYLTMNMFYNDYKMVFEKYNMNNKDIILDFTEAFINDEDGPKYKTEKYFLLLK